MINPSDGIPEFYAGFADMYERLVVGKWCRHFNSEWIARHVHELDGMPQMRVLDLGCVTGLNVKSLLAHRQGIRADGVDLSPKMLEHARRSGNYDNLFIHDLHDPITKICSESYDLAIAFTFIEHLASPLMCLAEASRALKEGGTLWASFKAFEANDEGSPPRHSVINGVRCTGYSVSHNLHMVSSLEMRVIALELMVGYLTEVGVVGTTYKRQVDSSVIHNMIGEAAALIYAARALMFDATEAVDRATLSGCALADLDQRRHRAVVSCASDLVAKAVEKLMYVSGSSAFFDTNFAQRMWRDVSVATRHALILPHVGYETYGRALLGIQTSIEPVVLV